MRRSALLVALGLVGCGSPERTAEDFAADPDAAEAVVAACDAGRAERECEAARQGLAEARRQARMRVYERAF
ncbi:MAG: EexN family lipoprotein [Brevundimonas sp.]|uniref:EexN family lipoprotein n=1 Tax=Brevundimonas vesicularis TaxID=41276 RepID=A0ABU4KQP4_BREVE|nr:MULTISPECIES: EexN family lipoprotein [Brevundimonas]MDX2335313.1 EexN family lipoprotein [Brevundimonas vesicularis]